MKKIYKLEQLEALKEGYTKEVMESIEEIIITINENYGAGRDVDKDLGGYVVILESEEDVAEIKVNVLKGTIEEYTDKIDSNNGETYYASLFILSSDYIVMAYSNKELHEILIEKEL
ncbi:hypothetical protein CLPUN_53550 [Clostridium puniceum]|uniref:Uncharacterized protein n=1 Tax=Clostridium puniceum TaxID=29367 RepID=A0A1S8SX62_9CLOT|nr:hypothetical protein [Clostridium puniceum]OOM70023.1 hypothetical protein CLPUN_53550 [Clostridium puniceum]